MGPEELFDMAHKAALAEVKRVYVHPHRRDGHQVVGFWRDSQPSHLAAEPPLLDARPSEQLVGELQEAVAAVHKNPSDSPDGLRAKHHARQLTAVLSTRLAEREAGDLEPGDIYFSEPNWLHPDYATVDRVVSNEPQEQDKFSAPGEQSVLIKFEGGGHLAADRWSQEHIIDPHWSPVGDDDEFEVHWDHSYEGDNAAMVTGRREALALAGSLQEKPYMSRVRVTHGASGRNVLDWDARG